MMERITGRFRPSWLVAGLALSASTMAGAAPPVGGAPPPRLAQLPEPMPPPPARPEPPRPLPPSPPSILDPNVRDIDLNTALRLAGVQNPQLMIARQRVVEAAALRQLAAAFILPSLNLGGELRHAHRRPPAVQRQHPLGQPQLGLRRGGCERGRGRHGEHPRRGADRQHRRGGLRLPDVAAGGGAARVRDRGDPQPGVPGDDAGLLRAAPRRGEAGRRDAGPRRRA